MRRSLPSVTSHRNDRRTRGIRLGPIGGVAGAPAGPFGSSSSGLLALHQMLAILYWLAIRGHFSAKDHWGVEAVVKYWHFVDVVWVFFYPTLYLVSWV